MDRVYFGLPEDLIHRAYDSNPRRAPFEVFRGKALLRLYRGFYGCILAVLLNQQSRDLPTVVVLLHLPLKTWLQSLLAPTKSVHGY
ncbi:MAG: hypothetical protein MJE12_05220 [Alphaproteobacteria bacterium]|nr:hypothetical protein [Alphaproteobacteria bacterium]